MTSVHRFQEYSVATAWLLVECTSLTPNKYYFILYRERLSLRGYALLTQAAASSRKTERK
jgi:hypothetical protein